MQEVNNDSVIRLITYLSGQNDFVSAADIAKDGLSRPPSKEEAGAAIEMASQFLEFREDGGQRLLRLSRSLNGYRSAFARVKGSEADVYGFLGSAYSKSVVDAGFIGEALSRVLLLPHFKAMEAKYPPGNRPGDAVVLMLSRSPGFEALASMFRVSPGVAACILFPGTLSKYELTHLKVTLDLAFAADMLRRVPPATSVRLKYEVVAQGAINLETKGGTGIP